MASVHVGGLNVNLPDPEKIPTPRTRAALEKAIDIAAKRDAAFRDRDAADARLHALNEAEPQRLGRAMAEGTDPGESPIAEAKAIAEATQTHLTTVIAAEGFVAIQLREAVAADREAWARIALTAGRKATTRLTTAIKMAGEAYDELYTNIGLLNMFRLVEADGSALSLQHGRGASHFDIGEGIAALRSGLGDAAHELDQLAPLKPGKAPKVEAPAPLVASDEDDETDADEVDYSDEDDQ